MVSQDTIDRGSSEIVSDHWSPFRKTQWGSADSLVSSSLFPPLSGLPLSLPQSSSSSWSFGAGQRCGGGLTRRVRLIPHGIKARASFHPPLTLDFKSPLLISPCFCSSFLIFGIPSHRCKPAPPLPPNTCSPFHNYFLYPDMASPDTTTARGLLPPAFWVRLKGYIGLRDRFQPAAWCESHLSHIYSLPKSNTLFLNQFRRCCVPFVANVRLDYIRSVWASLRRGQLSVLFGGNDVREHSFAEFYQDFGESRTFPCPAHQLPKKSIHCLRSLPLSAPGQMQSLPKPCHSLHRAR